MDTITGVQVYWLTRCDAIKEALACNGGLFVLALTGVILVVLCTFGCMSVNSDIAQIKREDKVSTYGLECAEFELKCYTFVKKLGRWLLAVFLPLWLLCRVTHPFVPTTKEMAAIVVIPRVANSESVQGLGEGIVDLAKAWMQELRPSTVKATVKDAAAEAKAAINGTAQKVNDAVAGAKSTVDGTAQKVKAAVAGLKGASANSREAE